MSTSQAPIFYSVSAQHDNLGDIEIRRQMLSWLRETGRPLVIFGGPMPQSYKEAMGLVPTEIVVSSVKFELELLKAALQGRAAFILAPGPQVFGPRRLAVRSAINLLNAAIVRARGGHCIAVGRSLRGVTSLGKFLDRTLVRLFDIYSVRDDVSAAQIGLALQRHPDMAFGHLDTAATSRTRKLVTISLRYDRLVQVESLRPLIDECRKHGLDVVFASQVHRDDDQHARLARDLGVRAELWGQRSHTEQEEALRSSYRRTLFSVSNRLHGLIMAAQCGSLPVTLSADSSDKISSTFKDVLTHSSLPSEGLSDALTWLGEADVVTDKQNLLDRELHEARATLDSLRRSVVRTLATADEL